MKIFKGTVIGGIAFFLLGWLIYGILLMDYSAENYNHCANRPGENVIWWAMVLSNFTTAFLLTLILNWAGAKGAAGGLKYGAVFGFLVALAMNLSFYSMTTMFNHFFALVVDVLAYTVIMAIAGMVIVLVWGKPKELQPSGKDN